MAHHPALQDIPSVINGHVFVSAFDLCLQRPLAVFPFERRKAQALVLEIFSR